MSHDGNVIVSAEACYCFRLVHCVLMTNDRETQPNQQLTPTGIKQFSSIALANRDKRTRLLTGLSNLLGKVN